MTDRPPVLVLPDIAALRRRRASCGSRVLALPATPDLADTLLAQLRLLGLPLPEREYQFDESRDWRLDLAYPSVSLAIECEGLTREGGRHQRRAGYEEDCRKYDAAVMQGWTLLRFTKAMIESLEAVGLIEIILRRNGLIEE